MGFKALLILVIVAVLMEDSASIRKTEEEKEEERELAERVNKTLADEKKKEDEEKRQNDEKKKQLDLEKKKETKKGKDKEDEKKKTVEPGKVVVEDKDEAFPSSNCTDSCPTPVECESCPDFEECPEVKPCGPCPEERPCLPCSSLNRTSLDVECPAPPVCPGDPGLTVPVAMMVGAITGLVAMGVATVLGFLLRYAPPVVSGLLFLSIVLLTWFLSSRYPDVAREAGGRVVAVLREATVALGHRIMEAIQRHQEQVCVPSNSTLSYSLI
jgi:hypothetical protein